MKRDLFIQEKRNDFQIVIFFNFLYKLDERNGLMIGLNRTSPFLVVRILEDDIGIFLSFMII